MLFRSTRPTAIARASKSSPRRTPRSPKKGSLRRHRTASGSKHGSDASPRHSPPLSRSSGGLMHLASLRPSPTTGDDVSPGDLLPPAARRTAALAPNALVNNLGHANLKRCELSALPPLLHHVSSLVLSLDASYNDIRSLSDAKSTSSTVSESLSLQSESTTSNQVNKHTNNNDDDEDRKSVV